MAPPGLCLFLLGVVSGTPPEDLTLNVGAKLETAVGTNLSSEVPPGSVSVLISLTPSAVLSARSQTGSVKLSYTPLLYGSLPTSEQFSSKVLVLHRMTYEATNQLSPIASISLTGSFWYGDQNYSPVTSQGVAPGSGIGQPSGTQLPPGTLPQEQVLKVLQSVTQLGLSLATSATVDFKFDVGFLYSEGADAVARLQLPLQRGPFILVRSDVLLNERDTLVPALRVGLLYYGPIFREAGSGNENGSTVVVSHFQEGLGLHDVELTLKWGHDESRALHTELGAGIAHIHFNDSSDVLLGQSGDLVWIGRTPSVPVPGEPFFYPIVTGSLRYRVFSEVGPVDLSVSAGLAPLINQFAGTVSQRLAGTFFLDWFPTPLLRLETSAGVSNTFNPEDFEVRGDISAVWSPAATVAIAVGARAAWVQYAIPGALNGFSWSVFLSVTGASGALF